MVTCHEEHGAIATIKNGYGALKITISPPIMQFLSLFWRTELITNISLHLPGAFLAWNIPMSVVTCYEGHGAIATIKNSYGASKMTIFPHIMLFLVYFGGNSI